MANGARLSDTKDHVGAMHHDFKATFLSCLRLAKSGFSRKEKEPDNRVANGNQAFRGPWVPSVRARFSYKIKNLCKSVACPISNSWSRNRQHPLQRAKKTNDRSYHLFIFTQPPFNISSSRTVQKGNADSPPS